MICESGLEIWVRNMNSIVVGDGNFRTQNKEFKSFYKTVGGNEGALCNYNTRLDTYGCGCAHDCSYCYAKSLLDFRGLWHPLSPSVADIDKIKKKIKRITPDVGVVRLGGMTDCFQLIEAIEEVTFQTIQALNDAGIGYLIVTKSTLIGDKKYLDVLDKDLAHIQVSISSTDFEFSKTYEHAPSPLERIKVAEKLQSCGFDTAIRVAPYLAGHVDTDIVNNAAVDKILVEFLRGNTFIKRLFPDIGGMIIH